MENLSDRLSILIETLNITKTAFGAKIEYSGGNIGDWVHKTKKSNPTAKALTRICNEYHVNINWLLTGKGEMFIPEWDAFFINDGDHNLINQDSSSNFDSRTIALPLAGFINAGDENEGNLKTYEHYVEIPKKYLEFSDGHYNVLKVLGSEYSPEFSNGDLAVILHQVTWHDVNGKMCVIDTKNGLRVFRVTEEADQVLLISPTKTEATSVRFNSLKNDYRLVGKIAMILRVDFEGSHRRKKD